VIERGKIHILDALGLALAGSIALPAQMTRDHVLSVCAADGDASILGTGHRAPARFAALCNGTSIHADNSTTPTRRPMPPATAAFTPLVQFWPRRWHSAKA